MFSFMNPGKSKPAKKGLKIIIVGCGKVGTTLVEQLSKEGHDIIIIDKNAKKVQEIANIYDIMGIVGNGASYSVQMDAGIEDTDLIISVTESDELNLLCCTVAKQVGDCAAIARVRTPDYSKEAGYLREKLGLAMIINPELEAAREAARILFLPSALEVNSFAHGQAELIKFAIPAGNILDGLQIAELRGKIETNILVCGVERDGEVHIPSGDFILQQGDVISVVASRKIAREFLSHIGFETKQVKNTMIIGGGKAAYYLAKNLLDVGIDVKIIESNKERCEELSILLPKAIIINGDGTDQELLREEGLPYVIAKLDLGSVIYPRYITSEAIIAYVRARQASLDSNIETLYHMFDHRVEAIEFRVYEESAVTNIPLKDLALKKDLLFCFINRNGAIILPNGQDSIQVGDTVMVVTTHTGFNDLRDILA